MDEDVPPTSASAMRWIVAQEGSRQSYAVPLAFHRLGLMRLFYADIWCRSGRSLLRHGTSGTRALAGRFRSEIPSDRVISFNQSAVVAKTFQHIRRGRQSPTELGESHCRFGRWFAQRVSRHLQTIELDPERDLFFGFDTNSLEVLEMLKQRGVFTVLDQVDAGQVHEEIVLEETERWPGWQKFPGRMPQSYWDRRQAEWAVADLVLVNSEWSKQAIMRQGVPPEKIIVVPLALDPHIHQPSPVNAEGTLKVLWLGNVILSKGIQYLVEAARLLEAENIQFLLAGPLGIEEKIVRTFPANIQVLGRITRDRLGEVYRDAHVFVLPTISDGFAVTQLEAMAHGLPVVITPNCGRVVTDGVEGLVVPARDSQALADALSRLNADRPLVAEMSRQALKTAHAYDLPSNARMICDLTLPHHVRHVENLK
ncbi:MAG TPA: glycosyltransferase family 4 protein [Verrucomicrobiae bacterium]|nr:glycosyltransferase family 4 protein [Verrucomicrobiae bacterium]